MFPKYKNYYPAYLQQISDSAFLMSRVIFKTFTESCRKGGFFPTRIEMSNVSICQHTKRSKTLFTLLRHKRSNGSGKCNRMMQKNHRRNSHKMCRQYGTNRVVAEKHNPLMITLKYPIHVTIPFIPMLF